MLLNSLIALFAVFYIICLAEENDPSLVGVWVFEWVHIVPLIVSQAARMRALTSSLGPFRFKAD